VIENIESLSAEFKGQALLDREVLEQRHIKVGLSGIAQDIATCVAKG
jgi:hypothetical protein